SEERETELPNQSPDAQSDAVSFACSVHVPPDRVKMYAAPAVDRAPFAPTTAVFPSEERETELPNQSPTALSEALTFVCVAQRRTATGDGITGTYEVLMPESPASDRTVFEVW
ncbi:hypothetical protein K678_17256, partial [Magnetospirillum fulvum MGU-K5]